MFRHAAGLKNAIYERSHSFITQRLSYTRNDLW
ncbi:hypothetical protein J3D56_000176 [Erwinia persicina]|nr:hypothetical protein [Erwinia persicina]